MNNNFNEDVLISYEAKNLNEQLSKLSKLSYLYNFAKTTHVPVHTKLFYNNSSPLKTTSPQRKLFKYI